MKDATMKLSLAALALAQQPLVEADEGNENVFFLVRNGVGELLKYYNHTMHEFIGEESR